MIRIMVDIEQRGHNIHINVHTKGKNHVTAVQQWVRNSFLEVIREGEKAIAQAMSAAARAVQSAAPEPTISETESEGTDGK